MSVRRRDLCSESQSLTFLLGKFQADDEWDLIKCLRLFFLIHKTILTPGQYNNLGSYRFNLNRLLFRFILPRNSSHDFLKNLFILSTRCPLFFIDLFGFLSYYLYKHSI